MILPNMTYKELYGGLLADQYKVDLKTKKLWPKALKELRAKNIYLEKYTVNNNQYVICFHGEGSYINTVNFCILFNDQHRFVLRCLSGGIDDSKTKTKYELPQVHVYTKHFFDRYNERYLKKENISYDEIAGVFFSRNTIITPVHIDEQINYKIEEYDDYAKVGCKIRDGFCFTRCAIQRELSAEKQPLAMRYLYTTFVSNKELSSMQKDAIEEESNNTWENWRKYSGVR